MSALEVEIFQLQQTRRYKSIKMLRIPRICLVSNIIQYKIFSSYEVRSHIAGLFDIINDINICIAAISNFVYHHFGDDTTKCNWTDFIFFISGLFLCLCRKSKI